jgi:hypothetical protein
MIAQWRESPKPLGTDLTIAQDTLLESGQTYILALPGFFQGLYAPKTSPLQQQG